MKSTWRTTCSLALLLVCCLAFTGALSEGACTLLFPTEAETTIAPERDFYVFARVPETAREGVVRLLDAQGNVVRVVSGGDTPTFFLDYPDLNAYNTDQAEYYMPDLIYDPDDPDSLWDGSTKCYVKNGLLFAVVAGGTYRMAGREITDADGKPYAPLTAGKYTLEVEAGGARATAEMTMAFSPAKIMSRYAPDRHMDNVMTAARDGSVRTYLDPFPGYWSPATFLPEQADNPYFAEIFERWRLADATEYMGGVIYFYIYNLSPTCATIAVELAALQLDNAVDTRMLPYYYDIGEPLLGYADSKTDVYLMGTFTPFAPGDKLAFTRAETTDEAQDNHYVAYTGDPRPIDLDVQDGVTVPAGKTLTLFGVTCPIQNAPEDIKKLGESYFEIGNLVKEIEYAFTCGDKAWTERREVGLHRVLAEGWEGYSLYEFAHSFVFEDALAGQTVSVAVQGFDAHDVAVDGTVETFAVQVAANP